MLVSIVFNKQNFLFIFANLVILIFINSFLLFFFSPLSDEQTDLGLSNSNFTASSNSSLSSGGGSESPSTSMEQMGGAGAAAVLASSMHQPHGHHHHGHHSVGAHHQHQHSHQDSFHGSIGGVSSNLSYWGAPGSNLTRNWNFESDDEDDLNEADWSSNVAATVLSALTDAEKKRQEIINGIIIKNSNDFCLK